MCTYLCMYIGMYVHVFSFSAVGILLFSDSHGKAFLPSVLFRYFTCVALRPPVPGCRVALSSFAQHQAALSVLTDAVGNVAEQSPLCTSSETKHSPARFPSASCIIIDGCLSDDQFRWARGVQVSVTLDLCTYLHVQVSLAAYSCQWHLGTFSKCIILYLNAMASLFNTK